MVLQFKTYIMIENLLVTFSGFMGFYTIALILYRYKSISVANRYLITVFLVISIRFLLIGLYGLNLFNTSFVEYLLNKYYNFMIFIVPCSYLYFKNLISNNKLQKENEYWHFVVPSGFVITDFIIQIATLDIEFIKYYYYSFFAIFCLFYFFIMWKLLDNNVWNRNGEINLAVKQNSLIKTWTKYLVVFLFLLAFRFIYSLFVEINNQQISFGTKFIGVAALFWIFLFIKVAFTPELLYGYNFLYEKIDKFENIDDAVISFWEIKENTTITNLQDLQLKEKIEDNISTYIKKIDQFSFGSENYRNSKFSIYDLSTHLQIPKSHLAYVFKYHSKISFPEYKKIVRIHDGLALIKSDYLKNNTLDSLSQKIGFASYNTFFISFKDVTGVTPQEFYFRILKNKIRS